MIKNLISSSFIFIFSPFAEASVKFEQFFITAAEQHKYQKSGGYIFFKRDFEANENYMCELKKIYPNALMMTDQENDVIYRIKHFKLPSHKENFKSKNIQDKANFTVQELKKLCLDVNLAPMVELSFDNKRSSNNLQISIDYSNFITSTLNKNKVAATWKHFPGGGFNRLPAAQTEFSHHYVKSSFSEGTVIYDDKQSLSKHIDAFSHKGFNLLMISNSVYPAYSHKPAIFTEEIIKKAVITQPNSLIISDDLEQINLKKLDILTSFKYVHMYMTSDYNQRDKVLKILNELFNEGLITKNQILEKEKMIRLWKVKNQLKVLN